MHTVFAELHGRFPYAVVTADASGISLDSGYRHLVFTILPASKHVTVGFAGRAVHGRPRTRYLTSARQKSRR